MQTQLPSNRTRPGGWKQATAYLRRRAGTAVTLLGVFALSVFVASCGDSGGGGGGEGTSVSSQVVSGVAATGAPLAGQVTLRDSSPARKDKATSVGTDGSFAIDVSDMSMPYILKATGTVDGVSRTLYSFADNSGVANINPLSSVALASAAGVDDPAEAFEKSDSAALEKIKSGMPVAIATLQEKLKPLLIAFNATGTNPVKGVFAADHDGLDGLFDNIKIDLVGGVVTITNASTGAVIFTAQVRDLEHGKLTENEDDLPKPGRRPAAPTGVTAVGGDGQLTISWDPVPNATSYDLLYSTQSKVAEEEDKDDKQHLKRVKNVTSPFVLSGLPVNATYYVMLRARIDGRKGPASAEVSATTSANTPAPSAPVAPADVTAIGGTNQVTINWSAVTGATSYNLYWSAISGVTTTNGTKISGVTSPAVHTGLIDGTTYYYIVTAVNSAGEGAASAQVAATTLGVAPSTTTTTAPTTTTTAGATTTTAAPTTTTAAPTTTTTAPTTTTAAPTTTTAAPTTTTAAPTTTTAAPTTTTAPPTTTTVPLPPPTTTTSTSTTTTTTATTTTTTLPALNGWVVYDAYCSACHGATGKMGRTAAQITTAINNNAGGIMNMLVSTGGCDSCHAIPPSTTGPLSAAQIAAIAARTLPRP